jgi:hypothetical protein
MNKLISKQCLGLSLLPLMLILKYEKGIKAVKGI